MGEPIYGKINTVELNDACCSIQKIEYEDETMFELKRGDEVYCIVMLDEQNQWKPDIDMSEAEFNKIMFWINKLYLHQ